MKVSAVLEPKKHRNFETRATARLELNIENVPWIACNKTSVVEACSILSLLFEHKKYVLQLLFTRYC